MPCVTDLGPENCAWGPSGICTIFLRPAPSPPPQRAMLWERAPDLPPTPQPEVETGHSLSEHVFRFEHPRSVWEIVFAHCLAGRLRKCLAHLAAEWAGWPVLGLIRA